ncbi:MAG TPA: ornithine--oxo-acid transaminase, partial [Micrococcales bacterium]|nr:ornithine--oxo-acid transaminase [Micrococcales bacterium]
MAAFVTDLAELAGKDMVVPMNTGAEAVETAIKIARKHAHDVRGIASPEIVVASGNFHGRTTTIVSFSDDETARAGFGPFTPGFVTVPFGDADALAAALTPS